MKYSSEEKKRVAQELRSIKEIGKGATNFGHGYVLTLLMIVLGNDNIRDKDYDNYFVWMCNKLADLIDS